MGPDGVHLLEDESVPLTLMTDGNVKLRIQAVVRKE